MFRKMLYTILTFWRAPGVGRGSGWVEYPSGSEGMGEADRLDIEGVGEWPRRLILRLASPRGALC